MDVHPKLQLPLDQLAKYLQNHHGLHQDQHMVIKQFKHGQSNPTYYIEYGGEKLVLRKKPVRVMNCIHVKAYFTLWLKPLTSNL